MKIGKISNELLQSAILDSISYQRPEVIIRPNIGEDCSVLEFGKNENIVLSTDPITGATKHIGNLAVHISCNDVSTSGAEPVGILVTILLPPDSTEEEFKVIMKDITKAAKDSNIEIIGGHTEITDAVTRPVVSTTVIGKVKKEDMIATNGALDGQDIILTKWAGLEGTAILANEYESVLVEALGQQVVDAAKSLENHLSVVRESKVAHKCGVTSMHDATEGGILGAVWEVAECAGVGIIIEKDQIPVKNETKQICGFFDISPYRLISSGCMVMTTFDSQQCLKELEKLNIPAYVIGKITKQEKKIVIDGVAQDLMPPESDELYKVFKRTSS